MHLRILPDQQNQVHKKKYFLMSGVVKNVFGAFSGHQNQVLKKIFSDAWSGKKRVSMHFLTTRIKSFKNYFLMSGVVKNVF